MGQSVEEKRAMIDDLFLMWIIWGEELYVFGEYRDSNVLVKEFFF